MERAISPLVTVVRAWRSRPDAVVVGAKQKLAEVTAMRQLLPMAKCTVSESLGAILETAHATLTGAHGAPGIQFFRRGIRKLIPALVAREIYVAVLAHRAQVITIVTPTFGVTKRNGTRPDFLPHHT